MPFVQFRVIQIPRWKIALGAALFVALLVALFILAAGVLLLLLPIMAIGGAFAYLFGNRAKSHVSDGVIDAEYREIELKPLEHDKK